MKRIYLLFIVALLCKSCQAPREKTDSAVSETTMTNELDRTILPIPEPRRQSYTELDATDDGTPVTNYGAASHFTGHVDKVKIEVFPEKK